MDLSFASRHSSLKRWCELALLFVLMPIMLWIVRPYIASWVLPIVSVIAATCLLLLIRDQGFKRFRLTNKRGFSQRLAKTLSLFLLVMAASTLVLALISPEKLFVMPQWPNSWLLLLLLYPLFSALPQELIFRTFFFHRYKRIIPRKRHRVWLSSTSFGLAHIIYGNWVAVVLSMIAGYCFSQTYAVSRSTLLVALEHSLWGMWIFTLGLGQYFDLSQQVI